jgi:hypothetical protein
MKNAKRFTRLVIVILIGALVILGAVGIILNMTGIRYIKGDNGTRFFGKLDDGVVLRGTVRLPDGTKGKIDRELGTIVYSNGDVYDGVFANNKFSGTGDVRVTTKKGVYEGAVEGFNCKNDGVVAKIKAPKVPRFEYSTIYVKY